MSSVWPDVQGQGGAVEALAQQLAAQEGRDPAGAGDDLQDPGDDVVFQLRQHLGDRGGFPGLAGGRADQPGRDGGAAVGRPGPPALAARCPGWLGRGRPLAARGPGCCGAGGWVRMWW